MNSMCSKLIVIAVISGLCCGQVYYYGAQQVALGSDKIVWSDDRYVEFYGKNISFIVDLQSDYDRFRNRLNLSESNVTLDGMFRSRGRTYPRVIAPSCTYSSNKPEIQLQPYYLTDKNQTYFTIKSTNLTLGVLNENCELSVNYFNQLLQASQKKQMIKLGDKYLGIKINALIYVINLELMIITQKLNLTPCYPAPSQQYQLNFNMDTKNQSWLLTISTETRLCIYERPSLNGNFNYLKQIRLDFPEMPHLALINSSVAFIMTKNCTLVRLDYSGLKSEQNDQAVQLALLGDKIVGYNQYTTKYFSYYTAGFMVLSTGQVYSIRGSVQSYITIPLQGGLTILKAGSQRISGSDEVRYFYVGSDFKARQYIPGSGTKIMTSVNQYDFTAINALDITDVGAMRVFAAGVSGGKLTVACFDRYDQFISVVYSVLPDTQVIYYATDVKIGYSLNNKLIHFYVIVKNTQTNLLSCFSYRLNNVIEELGWLPLNSQSFQFGQLIGTYQDSKIYWYQVEQGKNYICQINSQLELVKYFVGDDFKSFAVGDNVFRILRTTGRSDFYQTSPVEKYRYGSFFTENPNSQSFTLLSAIYPNYLYIETDTTSKLYSIQPNTMFISRTMAQRPTNLCSNAIIPPILSSPQSAYTIFISSTGDSGAQQITVYLTFYQPYYGYYQDKIYNIKMRYNDTLTLDIKSSQYSKQINSLCLELVPSSNRNKVLLALIRLDYMEERRDYAIWDWVYHFDRTEVQSYRLGSDGLVVYGRAGSNIRRFNPIGISPQLPWYFDKGILPYLVAKGGKVGIYLVNNSYHSTAIDLISGQELYTFPNTIFAAISPNSKFLLLKNKSSPSVVTIYKQTTLLGRVYLVIPTTNTSLLTFMNDNLMLFIEGAGATRNLYTYKLSENPFEYKMSTYQFTDISKQPLISYNQTHIGFQSGTFITVFNQDLAIVQKLSTTPIEHDPESISLSSGANIYAKFNNKLHIWVPGECKDGKQNQDGICSDGSGPSGGALIGIIVGVVAGVVVAGVGGFFLFKKLRARSKVDDPLLEDNQEDVMTGSQTTSFKNQTQDR